MDTKQKGNKMSIVHLTLLALVIGLVVAAMLLTNGNFRFADFILKLHGG